MIQKNRENNISRQELSSIKQKCINLESKLTRSSSALQEITLEKNSVATTAENLKIKNGKFEAEVKCKV
jgi:hypothetical protein